jgi:hypothetical protein
MRTLKRNVATALAAAALTGGLLALAAPANAATAESHSVTAGQAAVSSDVAPQWTRVYRGSFLYLSTCDTYGRSWVSSGAARAYNCGLDNRYPGLPWSLYTFH